MQREPERTERENRIYESPQGPRLLREVGSTLWHYVRGQLLISLILAGLYAVGFALLGVPLWFLLALVSGFLNLIPWFGTVIAMLLGLLVSLLAGLEVWRILAVIGVYATASAIESFLLTPRIHGRHIRIRPLFVFFAVLAGGLAFGFFGMLLAIPALAVGVVIYRWYYERGEQERLRQQQPEPGHRR